ncbi:ASKHA domain-containing protein [Desulfovermiculus halophilus]|uniref:ASKHA domain-containing protein n=1 Tax=Desulfovermiculus halophilus TaxID=339722 RepID=UPI0006865D6A|nr:ASKHA domain-containing protein [Desulfovermiculus halophilus]
MPDTSTGSQSTSPRWVYTVHLDQPSFEDNTADVDRLLRELRRRSGWHNLTCDLEWMNELPSMLRDSGFALRCTLFSDGVSAVLTGAAPAGEDRPALGLAVDLGTTRYVLQLIDLASGQALGKMDRANPQGEIGPDILTRIHHAARSEGLEQLQDMLIRDMNQAVEELCAEQGVSSQAVHNVALAGNTAMTHLFLGLDPRWMIREPYIPVVNDPGLVRAQALGLAIHPRARVYCFPNIGSYFGGDLLAGIVFSGLDVRDEPTLLVDVGTNAEVILGNKDWLIACAGAAGPALEGGVSKIGAQAGPGIIDSVQIDPESLDIEVHSIEELPPAGICGSGIIDLAAQMFMAGLLDFRGKMVPERAPELFVQEDGIWNFRLVPARESGTGADLLIGQPEIDSLVRSKAAMFTILETLVGSVGIGFEEIGAFFVAGTFGNFIKPDSAIGIGMLPDLPRGLFQSLGNSSLGGGVRLLQDPEAISRVKKARERITYLELNVNQAFMNQFSAAKFLPHTERSKFPSVRIPS